MYMVYKHVCVSVLLSHVRTLNALFYDSLPYSSRTRYLTESGARLAATNWAIFLIPSVQFSILQAHMVTCAFYSRAYVQAQVLMLIQQALLLLLNHRCILSTSFLKRTNHMIQQLHISKKHHCMHIQCVT